MVAAVRQGASLRSVAARFHVSLRTVQHWVRRAGERPLDRVDWADHLRGRRCPVNRTPSETEDLVLTVRRNLRERSDLGEFGAKAIREELDKCGKARVPSLRTIGRILVRRGALDGRTRSYRKAPPRGWYLPDVVAREAEVDSFDVIEDLVIRGGFEVNVLTTLSLHGGLVGSWPMASVTAKATVKALVEHWRDWGVPRYAQFDNDTRFQGPHHFPDAVGRVIRLCMSLGVEPVFVPPQETGFQAGIENFNGRWQTKVWSRFRHRSLAGLRRRSERFLEASRAKAAERIDAAPPRKQFPEDWALDLQAPLCGRLIYLRRTSSDGQVHLLGRTFPVDPLWPHRLVRAVVDLTENKIRFHGLRRSQPFVQPVLAEVVYSIPQKAFLE